MFVVIEASVDNLEKSSKKQRASSVDTSAAQVSDVNISGVSSTPASEAGESTTARRTRAKTAISMPSLVEMPPPPEIPAEIPLPMVDNDVQLVQVSSSGDEMALPSGSNEAMVRSRISV